MAGEYVIAATAETNTTTPLPGALALVRNNLAGQPALQLTSNASATNARLEGKAHPIAGDLYQYWVTLTPTADAAGLPAVSASTYVRLPNSSARAAPSAPMPVRMTPNADWL